VNSQASEQYLADVEVGARGWLHERWMESFYPEDIPDDWRLGFYANEFNSLLVPWSLWSESIEDLTEALDDTGDDFHLYLELPAQQQSLPVHLVEIKDSVTGLVCTESNPESWVDEVSSFNISLLANITEGDDAFQRLVAFPQGKKLELVLMESAKIDDLAMMREQLEKALADAETRLDLIFIDATPDMEAMQNTKMMAELMGA